MDPVTAGAIAAPVIGGLFGRSGQSAANKANMAIAKMQMGFQEKMRATQYQTAVMDMKAAGLNPALAYQQGGAGNLPGAGAQMVNEMSGVSEGVSNSVANALAVKQMRAAIDRISQEARGAKADADLKSAINRAYGFVMRPNGSVEFNMDMPNLIDKIQAEVSSAKSIARLNNAQLPEAESFAELWKMMGQGGAAGQFGMKQLQVLLPLLLRSLARGGR